MVIQGFIYGLFAFNPDRGNQSTWSWSACFKAGFSILVQVSNAFNLG